MGVNLHMSSVEDKFISAVTHEVLYCVAVAIWLCEGCITQAIDDFEQLTRKILLISTEFF